MVEIDERRYRHAPGDGGFKEQGTEPTERTLPRTFGRLGHWQPEGNQPDKRAHGTLVPDHR